MQALIQETKREAQLEDSYLGFAIRIHEGSYVATPQGWTGDVLLAESLPTLRRTIWRWWHMVQ
jgi:hypothetical protein